MMPALTRHRGVPYTGPAITLVSKADGGAQASSAAITAPAGIQSGDLLYAVFVCDDTAAAVSLTCAGWTLHASHLFTTHNNNGFIGAFYKIATASEPASYTFSSATATAMTIGILCFSGVSQSSPFAGIAPATHSAAAATACVFPAITLTAPMYVLAVAGQGGNYTNNVSNAFTPPAGYTLTDSSISQYNQGGTGSDSESVFSMLSNSGFAAGTRTPLNGTFNTSYAYGSMTVALNPV